MDHDEVDDDVIRDILSNGKGAWEGDTFTPNLSAVADMVDPMNLVTYFKKHGGENKLNLP